MAKKQNVKIKNIGVFTSGGDAPGMNAAVRAVVRTGIFRGLKVTGILHGYQGMLSNDYVTLEPSSVANILQRGGTIIKTGRCMAFHEKKTRALAASHLQKHGIDALVAIGGDGTFRGAHALFQETGFPIIGVPGTIDNDVYGTDETIGFDTAVNTALSAIDKIRDTAASHDRLFIVEVMGRNSGYIAASVGVAGGAEAVICPENPMTDKEVTASINRGLKRGKSSSILIVAEGDKPGKAYALAQALKKSADFEAKVCILGHIQRGGSPTARDRVLASSLGAAAVNWLIEGKSDLMAGQVHDQIVPTPLADTFTKRKPLKDDLVKLQTILAT